MTACALTQAFKTAKPAFGAWIALPGIFSSRVVARSSPHLSWVMIDCEHELTSLQTGAAESTQAIVGLGNDAPSALVRIPVTGSRTNTSWQIKYALDAGARGVLVPMVSDAAKAKRSFWIATFRSLVGEDSLFTQDVWGKLNVAEYLKSANDHITVMVQIETRDGVKNVEDIAAVDAIG